MTGLQWGLVGLVAYAAILIFAMALARAADRADRALGYKNEEDDEC